MKKAMLLGSRRLKDGDEAIKVMKWSKPNFKKAFGVELGSKTYSPQEFVKKFPKYAKYSPSGQAKTFSMKDLNMQMRIDRKAKGLPAPRKSQNWLKKLLPF